MQASSSSTSASTSSSNDYQTPMEIDIDVDYDLYGSERWHFVVPKNWIKTLSKDREKIYKSKQNAINSRLEFSSLYKQAYKKN